MRKWRTFARPIAAALSISLGVCQAQTVMTHHVRRSTQDGSARFLGQLSGMQTLRLVITLPLRNQDELDQLLKDLYDPSSPSYHHFLTVEQFTAEFGPSQQEYDALIDWAQENGLTVTGTSRNRVNLQVSGTAAHIQSAFHVSLGVYRHPTENRWFYAPDREPSTGLSFALWHVSGLNNFSVPKPAGLKVRSESSGASSAATTGSGSSASFLGSDMRAAYYGGTALTGAGQSLGLLEFAGADLADLDTYFTKVNQTNSVPITLLSTDGTSKGCLDSLAGGFCDDTEQTIDMTQALGMAPGLSRLVVYIGSSDAAILNAMATAEPLNAQLSCSWTWTPVDPGTDDPYFEEFKAQGQSFFQASGDSEKWTPSGVDSEIFPADDEHVTSVGGTDLYTSAAGGAWSSETAWAYGGGGISPDRFALPAWQQSAADGCASCSLTYRNGPDVSANAKESYYVCADQKPCSANEYGGTSFAAPIWAGYLALANQQSMANGYGTLGFINPSLYIFGESSSHDSDFHDVTGGSNGYSATTGYDLATGWGSPNGSGLIDALAPTPQTYAVSASPTPVSVAQGQTGTTSVSTTISGGFNSAIALSASGMPAGVTVGFSPPSIAGAGSSTLTFTVAASAAPGTYSIAVAGTSGATVETTSVSLTVTATAFSISLSPAAISIAQSGSGSVVITTTVTGGFTSGLTLWSTPPAGVTAELSSTNIANPDGGTATYTLTVADTVKPGTYNFKITGKGGGVTNIAKLTLTVTAAPAYAVSASPKPVSVAQGHTGTTSISTTISGGFNSAIALSASGMPAGVTVGFNPASIVGAGNSTLTFTAGASAAPGTYSIVVSGSSGATVETTTVSLTVTATAFSISLSPAAISIARGGSGSVVITSAATGGFNSALTLWTGTLPAGVTGELSPTTIANPNGGTATYTLTVADTAKPGTYYFKITGKGGGVTIIAKLTLVILP
ncbi:MAG: protease pro-enzyme activation domain-containing protein [Terracidiphilus sp.]